jgi:tape measure domain-containing protein
LPEQYRIGITVEVDARGRPVLTGVRRDVDKLKTAVDRNSESTRRAARERKRLERATAQIAARYGLATRAVDRHRMSLQATGSAAAAWLTRVGGVAGGAYVLNRFAQAAVRAADANLELRSRLRLVTDSERELEQRRRSLIQISRQTRTSVQQNAALYSRLALTVDAAVASEQELLEVVRILNQQIKIGGGDAESAARGLEQLVQGLQSGQLQGEELKSVLEQLPGVLNGLLLGFRKLREQGEIDFEVTAGNIRELAAGGRLSAELLVDAIRVTRDETQETFDDLAVGIGESLALIRQELVLTLDRVEQGAGVFGSFARGLERIRNLTFGGAAPVGAGGALAVNQELSDLVQAGFRDRDVVQAGRSGLAARAEDLAAGRLRGQGIVELSDEDLRGIVGRSAAETGSFARRTLEQAIGPFIQARFRSGFEALIEETERQFQTEALAAVTELDLRASPGGSPGRNAFLAEQDAAQAAERATAAEAALADQRERAAKQFASLQRMALTEEEAIEAAFEERIALVDLFAGTLDDNGASLREFAAAERGAALEALLLARSEEEAAGAVNLAASQASLLRPEIERLREGRHAARMEIEREREEP